MKSKISWGDKAEAAGMSNGAAFRYCYGMYEKGILSRIVNGNGPLDYFVR